MLMRVQENVTKRNREKTLVKDSCPKEKERDKQEVSIKREHSFLFINLLHSHPTYHGSVFAGVRGSLGIDSSNFGALLSSNKHSMIDTNGCHRSSSFI